MNKYTLFTLLLLGISLSFCKEPGGFALGGPSGKPDSTYMRAIVNGNFWYADTAFGSIYSDTVYGNDTSVTIIAIQDSTASQIVLYIANYHGVGTYDVNPP